MMLRRIRKTFDWEVAVWFLAAGTVVYVAGAALLSVGMGRLAHPPMRLVGG